MIEDARQFCISEEKYQTVFDEMVAGDSEEAFEEFREETSWAWIKHYKAGLTMLDIQDVGDIHATTRSGFDYLENHSFEHSGYDAVHRDNPRMIAVHGFSRLVEDPRDDKRLRYHRDSYVREFGESRSDYPYDKGHYIGHRLGGEVDDGIFAQIRKVNRGHTPYQEFRQMEAYAQRNLGTFVFTRPIYGDASCHPFFIEFGVLRTDKRWWVRLFPNRYTFTPYQGVEGFPLWKREQLRIRRERYEARMARRKP